MSKRDRRLITPEIVRSGRRAMAQIFKLDVRSEVDEEFAFHVEMRTRELMNAGFSEEEARARATAFFGDIDRVKSECRKVGGERDLKMKRRMWFESIAQDVRFAFRQLARRKGFTAITVLTLGLGIGANTAIFSFIDNVLLRPLPFSNPEELMHVTNGFSSPGNFTDLERETRTLQSVFAFNGGSLDRTDADEPMELRTANTSRAFFDVLQLRPVVGRFFQEADMVADIPTVTVLSEELWARAYGSDPDVVGSTISLNDEAVEIIGVAPAGISEPFFRDLWLPYQWDQAMQTLRSSRFFRVYGRLAPGETEETARLEIEQLHERIATAYPVIEDGFSGQLASMKETLVRGDRPLLLLLGGAALFVLLIVCTNVAHLVLARSETRGQEMAVRSALGSGRRRLLAQLFTENLVLAAIGGVAGVIVAFLGVAWLVQVFGDTIARTETVQVDFRILGFTLLLSLLTGLLIGIAPALQTRSMEPTRELARGKLGKGRRNKRVRTVLLVSEVALALLLVVGAGLFLKSFMRVYEVDVGFPSERMLTGFVSLPGYRYSSGEEQQAFFQEFVRRAEALPGVESVGLITKLPFQGGNNNFTRMNPVGRSEPEVNWVESRVTSPGYFEAIGTTIVAGRELTENDVADLSSVGETEAPVEMAVVVNEVVADGLFPDTDPLGQLIWSDQLDGIVLRIVGVVESVRDFGPTRSAPPAVYATYLQWSRSGLHLMARTTGDPMSSLAGVQSILSEMDPQILLRNPTSMGDVLDANLGDSRMILSLLGLFAGLALVLSAIGIYGVTSYTTAQRTQEVGIRMALGAEANQVMFHIVQDGARYAAVGILVGVLGAIGLRKMVESLLFDVSPLDPIIYIVVSAALAAVTVTACYIPAKRASQIQPAQALRRY